MDNRYEEMVNAIRAGDTAKAAELLGANPDLDAIESPLKVSFFTDGTIFRQTGCSQGVSGKRTWDDFPRDGCLG